jgi:hypothetical protein
MRLLKPPPIRLWNDFGERLAYDQFVLHLGQWASSTDERDIMGLARRCTEVLNKEPARGRLSPDMTSRRARLAVS